MWVTHVWVKRGWGGGQKREKGGRKPPLAAPPAWLCAQRKALTCKGGRDLSIRRSYTMANRSTASWPCLKNKSIIYMPVLCMSLKARDSLITYTKVYIWSAKRCPRNSLAISDFCKSKNKLDIAQLALCFPLQHHTTKPPTPYHQTHKGFCLRWLEIVSRRVKTAYNCDRMSMA